MKRTASFLTTEYGQISLASSFYCQFKISTFIQCFFLKWQKENFFVEFSFFNKIKSKTQCDLAGDLQKWGEIYLGRLQIMNRLYSKCLLP